MSKAFRRGAVAALAVVFMAGLLGGCGLFQSQQKDDPFGEAERTSSTRSADTTTSESQPAPSSWSTTPSQPPADTYVEPARPWGAETRDNINNQ